MGDRAEVQLLKHLGLADKLAVKAWCRWPVVPLELDDWKQVARIGLWRAARDYLRTTDHRGQFVTYAYRAIWNACLRQLRSEVGEGPRANRPGKPASARQPLQIVDPDILYLDLGDDSDTSEQWDQEIDAGRLVAALKSPQQREFLLLRYWCDMTQEEARVAMGRSSTGSMHELQTMALRRLREVAL